MTTKDHCSKSECIKKLLFLPSIYAFLLALILNLTQFPIPESYRDFILHIKGVFTVLGMMIIGLGLVGLSSKNIDFRFIGMTFLAKFLAWPLLVLSIIGADIYFFHFYEQQIHHALFVLSITPLAVNTVVMASLMKANSEKVSITVLLSTLFALFYIPLMTSIFIGN